MGNRRTTRKNEYVILGTSHGVQDSSEFGKPLAQTVEKHAVELVTEEYPFPGIPSAVQHITSQLGRKYLQIDPPAVEWHTLGISEEMQIRANAQCLQGKDVRLSHADSVREKFWLEKIEKYIDDGRVLVICGYLHQHFLADSIRERGGKVLEQIAYPKDLLDREPEHIFTLAELKEYVTERQ